MGQTVNLLSFDFGGSNPSLPTCVEKGECKPALIVLSGSYLCLFANSLCKLNCGSSSVDRALAFQAEGRGFEPRLPLFFNAVIAQW